MNPIKLRHVLPAAFLTAALSLQAQVVTEPLTYVPAEARTGNGFETNTFPDTAFNTAEAQDDLWWIRPGFGTGDVIYEISGNAGAEDGQEIFTVINGLTPGEEYYVWVNFYDPHHPNDPENEEHWNIRGGFESGDLTLFANELDGGADALDAVGAGMASDFSYVDDPKFDDGGSRMLLAGFLGSTFADTEGEISVFVDDLPAEITSNNRSWYDGVSYVVVPEPGTYAILFGAMALAYVVIRRRRG